MKTPTNWTLWHLGQQGSRAAEHANVGNGWKSSGAPWLKKLTLQKGDILPMLDRNNKCV